MVVTKTDLKRVQTAFKYINNRYEWFEQDESLENVLEDLTENLGNDIQHVEISFPADSDVTIGYKELLSYCDEIPTLKVESNGVLKTKLLRLYVVDITDTESDIPFYEILKGVTMKVREGIEISLVRDNIIVGLAATELDEYTEDYWGTVSPYTAIELRYKSEDLIVVEEQEMETVRSFMFEIADTTGVALSFSEIRNHYLTYADFDEVAGKNKLKQLRELEQYNEGMRLFVSAVQIQEAELKFLNFYKILEHFAPIAVNIEANELMRKKLDVSKSQMEDGDYIRSIFDLASSMKNKFNDEDLIKSTFNTCFDFIGLFGSLPQTIQTKVKKQIQISELSYGLEKQKVTTASNMVSRIIYATRNKVVHAKSNFSVDGNECTADEMEQLNVFMKRACSQSIRWYNRQPKHFKLNIIK